MAEKLLDPKAVANAKSGDADFSLRDGGGLFLLVKTSGRKLWRYRYTLENKNLNGKRPERVAGLGSFPEVSLARAREQRDKMRSAIEAGTDVVAAKKAERALKSDRSELATFEGFARKWHASRLSSGKWSPAYARKTIENLERNAFPKIGKRLITEIKRGEIKELLESERTGKRSAGSAIPLGEAHKLRQIISAIYQYAMHAEIVESNPAEALKGYLPERQIEHYNTITDPKRVGELLLAIDSYQGSIVVKSALRLAPYVFVRPTELRNAEWANFSLNTREPEWRIPGSRMKSGVEHRVPLSDQAIQILYELRQFTGAYRLLFPGMRDINRPISDNTVNAALRTLGYGGDVMTGHGFRGMASTLLNEKGWDADAIERQLAHGERDKVRAAYNHARKMPERRKMMQAWADYLDELREDARPKAPKPVPGEPHIPGRLRVIM